MRYFILFFISSSFVFSQNNEKIKFSYISFGTGLYSQQHINTNGIAGNIDVSVQYKKNLIVLYTTFGFGTNKKKSIFIFDNFSSFTELDLLYGKEFKIADWFKPEAHIGVGIFSYNNSILEQNNSSIGFPVRAKLLFYPSKNFALGFNPNYNINSINNIFSYNLIFQFKL